MEYVPRNANPYVSRVDAGTVELVRSFGVEVVPSGDLVQLFEACWDDEQWAMHLEAAQHTRSAYDVAFEFIADRVAPGRHGPRDGGAATSSSTISTSMHLVTDHPPIVAVGPHSGDPHYAPNAGERCTDPGGRFRADRPVGQARQAAGGLQRSDAGPASSATTCRQDITEIFNIVAAGARCRHQPCAATPSRPGERLQGWQVDQAARDVIEQAGYGDFFCHRTGHSHRPGNARQRRQHGQPGDATRNAACCRGPASPSSRGFICRSSAFAAR